MPYVLVQHTVENFDRWKDVFDEHGDTRDSYGQISERVFRNADSPNDVTILTEWESLDDAKAFLDDPSLREAMAKAGVTAPPHITFLLEGD